MFLANICIRDCVAVIYRVNVRVYVSHARQKVSKIKTIQAEDL